ncbi:MAG: restriction endonuclease subunit R [Crocinitomicaceae bacterium]|nr:restriction endonuclease subunit R [Crocinitomicaceae bacterium]|tara:strand:+ start:5856 stop:6311 length:456 start_codon:yes stop_codon:yes gene_type:complete
MQALNLPEYNFKFGLENGKTTIWDTIRKKYIILTPEEWVRQNFVEFLIQQHQFPRSLIQIEKGLRVHKTYKRADVICNNQNGYPVLLVECKAPEVKITQAAFDQVARYNITFKVPYLVVTNGISHYCCKVDLEKKDYTFLEELPSYNSIKA